MFKLNYSALDVAGRYHNVCMYVCMYVCIIGILIILLGLPGVTVDKSDAFMTKETGPTADPCMMLAVMR